MLFVFYISHKLFSAKKKWHGEEFATATSRPDKLTVGYFLPPASSYFVSCSYLFFRFSSILDALYNRSVMVLLRDGDSLCYVKNTFVCGCIFIYFSNILIAVEDVFRAFARLESVSWSHSTWRTRHSFLKPFYKTFSSNTQASYSPI